MSSDEDQDKDHEPSPQKLIEARKKGDIPRSVDLLTAAGIGGFVLAMGFMGSWAVGRAGQAGMVMLDQADRLSRHTGPGPDPLAMGLITAFAAPPLALLALPPLVVLAALTLTRGLVLAPSRLAPKLSRISPLATARQKFGSEGLVEFGKSTLKLCLVAALMYMFLAARIGDILSTMHLSPGLSATFLVRLMQEFLTLILLVVATIGGLDYLWQVHLHRKRNRMSRKEMLDEFKESEGDPYLKSARRQRAQEVATNRMLTDVATADVVLVNPTHYAVALRWNRSKGGAPICVAKGVDEVARRIRERAAIHAVPIHSDPPTARAIHSSVEIGQEIRAEHYRAVAAAIRFADAMRRKARRK